MSAWWQTLPQEIDPIAFSVGFFSLSWYALCYLAGAMVVIGWLWRRRERVEAFAQPDTFWAIVVPILWGVLIGARLGYVFWYGETSVYITDPWKIILPYDPIQDAWTGIRGLSFYGGLFGGALGLWWATRKWQHTFLKIADFIVPALPLALGLGRLGNFLNGELLGRITSMPWGMRFTPGSSDLRHPSQLYEALGEGVLLFAFLQIVAKTEWAKPSGHLTGFFLVGYGLMRFSLEFWREPDRGATLVFGALTANQLFALGLVIFGFWLFSGSFRSWYNRVS